MSMLRSILLHLDASPRSVRRLAIARELAVLHEAQVTALYACIPSVFNVPFAMAEGGTELLPMLQQLDADRRNEARALFDRASSDGATSIRWRELGNEALIPGVTGHALCADLLVLGQHDRSEPLTLGVPPDFIPSLLLASGKPALILPYVDVCATIGQSVLIAWRPTRESAHAVCAALPFLQQARRIHLVSEEMDAAGCTAELIDYLRLHGVQTKVERHAAVAAEAPGEGLLSLAAEQGCDLLVMGCYGHSRARELVLGGASRTVLESMTLPVLMVH